MALLTVQVGLDKNGNGQLDSDEVTSSTIVKDGEDGKSPLAEVVNSATVLIPLKFGLDKKNGDGKLYPTSTTIVKERRNWCYRCNWSGW